MTHNELYETTPEEFDTRLQAAAEILEKTAAEQGLDLNLVSDADKVDLLNEIMGELTTSTEEKVAAEEETPAAEEQPAVEETPASTDSEYTPTVTEVSLELNKRASAEGINLAEVTADQYEAMFSKVASDMIEEHAVANDPELQKIAAQEELFEHFGRIAARGFHDELNKLAAEEEAKKAPPFAKKEDGDEDEEKDDKGEEKKAGDDEDEKSEKSEGKKAPPFAKKDDDKSDDEEKKEASAKLLAGAAKALGKGDKAVQAVGDKAYSGIGKAVERVTGRAGTGAALSTTEKRVMGGGLLGAGALMATGAGMKATEKKASVIEAAATELARQHVLAMGVDPDSGEKLASDEEIEARAAEILREKGYL
jgi:hypothetical protein